MVQKGFAVVVLLSAFSFVSFKTLFSVEGLQVTVKNKREDYVLATQTGPHTSMPYVEAGEGMMFLELKLKFENLGNTICEFELNDIYVSDKNDLLYPVYSYGFQPPRPIKIKEGKSKTEWVTFQFPNDFDATHIYIENKKFKVSLD